jgi:hypothetical protein
MQVRQKRRRFQVTGCKVKHRDGRWKRRKMQTSDFTISVIRFTIYGFFNLEP